MSPFQDFSPSGVGTILLQTPPWGILHDPLGLTLLLTGWKGPWLLSHLAVPVLSPVSVEARKQEKGEEKSKRKRFHWREEGEHFQPITAMTM